MDDSYKTGIESIDLQHTELMNRIESLSLALYRGEAKKILSDLFEYLDSYIEEHFDIEEKLMFEKNYPDYSNHVNTHRNFIKTYNEIKKDFEKRGGDSYLAIRIEKEVRKWWENHIMTVDKQYIPFLK